jgi:hypothetical protein
MTGRAGPPAGCPLRESVLPVSLTVTSRLVRPVGDLPIHCKIIQVHCNAIQTLLQLNSNNYKFCALLNYFAVVDFRGFWWILVDFGARSRLKARFPTITENRRNSTYWCGIDFQCGGRHFF